jgi:hypothetical protein
MPQSVNKTQSKWCINKHGASKIIDTFETYQSFRHARGSMELVEHALNVDPKARPVKQPLKFELFLD